jgi:hypothetical protein
MKTTNQPFFAMLTIQKIEVECILCGHPATTLTGGMDQNCAVCNECEDILNERLLRRFSPLTKNETKSAAKKTAAKKTKCVYCKKTAAYQCDQCKNADKEGRGDGGRMCIDCSHEHGHEVGSLFLCGGCFDAQLEEEDCLANNPRCVRCNILLSEDDMNALTEEELPKCESCLLYIEPV